MCVFVPLVCFVPVCAVCGLEKEEWGGCVRGVWRGVVIDPRLLLYNSPVYHHGTTTNPQPPPSSPPPCPSTQGL